MGIHRLRSPVLLSVLRLRMGCGAVHPLGQAVIDTHAVRQRVAVQARAYMRIGERRHVCPFLAVTATIPHRG